MKINKAETLVYKLFHKHGLENWSFRWDKSIRRFGLCLRRPQLITLSRPLTEINDIHHVRDIILHEIAHAIAPAGTHHGDKWKRIAQEIGCNPSRTYNDDVVRPPAKYTAHCKNCGGTTQRNRRGKQTACGRCCQKFNGGEWSEKYILRYTKN